MFFCFVLFYFQLWLTKWVRHLQLHTHTAVLSMPVVLTQRTSDVCFIIEVKSSRMSVASFTQNMPFIIERLKSDHSSLKRETDAFLTSYLCTKLSIKPLKQWHRRKRPTLDSTKTENSIFSFPDLCFLYFVTMVCFYYYVQWRMLLLLKLMQRDMIHIHLQSFRAACDAGSMVAVWWASLI